MRAGRWASRIGLSRRLALPLTIAALVSGVATFGALSGSISLGLGAQTVPVLLYIDLVLVLLLCVIVLGRVVQLWVERRRGSAGSRLHIRLATLFSVVAVAPAIIVAVFSVLFLNLGIQAWFSERVRVALDESLGRCGGGLCQRARLQIMRAHVLAMAGDLDRAAGRRFMRDEARRVSTAPWRRRRRCASFPRRMVFRSATGGCYGQHAAQLLAGAVELELLPPIRAFARARPDRGRQMLTSPGGTTGCGRWCAWSMSVADGIS